jgi:acyl-CoA thioesterase
VESTREATAAQLLAERVTATLYERDRASQALGMAIAGVRPGFARLTMNVRADMVNGHELCHGGLLFTLADSAFAFACNSYNESTVAAAGSIDFLLAARLGDELTAEARELWRSKRNGLYEIVIFNQHGERVALFRGRSYRIEGQVVPLE